MAQRRDSADGGNELLVTRRNLLTAAGGGAVAGLLGATSPAGASPTAIDLGEEGLRDGDDVAPYVDEHFRSGNVVHVPAGTYELSDDGGLQRELSDAALIGSDGGVVLRRPSDPENTIRPGVKAAGGTVRLENFTIRGEKGEAPSRFRFDAVDADARIEVVNVNHPDGTVGCSDSLAFYVGEHHRGTVHFKNCYVADMGNSSFYVNQGYGADRSNPVIVENCTVINPNGAIRAGTNGAQYRDTTFVWRRRPNTWIDCATNARGIRWDNGGRDMLVENCHFYFASDVGNSGGALEFEDFPIGGTVRDVFVHNDTDVKTFWDKGGMGGFAFENVHVVGAGDTSGGDLDGVEHERGPDLRNENAIWMPESETVRPGSDSGGAQSSTPERGDGNTRSPAAQRGRWRPRSGADRR